MMRLLLLGILVLLLLLAAQVTIADASARACARPSAAKVASLPREYPRFYRALRSEFRSSWREAAVVSWGEGSWHWFARNGQYLGTFQVSAQWRRTLRGFQYHRWALPAQVRHAAKIWRRHGWGPWECRP